MAAFLSRCLLSLCGSARSQRCPVQLQLASPSLPLLRYKAGKPNIFTRLFLSLSSLDSPLPFPFITFAIVSLTHARSIQSVHQLINCGSNNLSLTFDTRRNQFDPSSILTSYKTSRYISTLKFYMNN